MEPNPQINTCLLYTSRCVIRDRTEDDPGVQAAWQPEPTLVLLATRYAPHTDYPPVTGNVSYIDPSTDAALLASLNRAQIFDYWTSAT